MKENNRTSDLERQVFHLQTLYEVADALSTCRDCSQIYKRILSILMGTFGVAFGVALTVTSRREWKVIAGRGQNDGLSDRLDRFLFSSNFDMKSKPRRESVLMEFVGNECNSRLDSSECVWLELSGRREILGGLFFGKKISGVVYTESDYELLHAAAGHATTALENLRLYEELKDAQERLQLENIALREEVVRNYEGGKIIGQSESIRNVLNQVKNMAKSPTNVLIYGETGTGKELVAKTIHYLSPRKDQPFVAVNCTAIPESLVESELFGIEAGVATGVKKHLGYFEQADGGTLFIDEIGDMPLSSQSKILRVLQERSFRRVGGLKEISVDVRVIAATNKNLDTEMKEGKFREDLFFRLSVLDLQLPPLRNRRDDVPLLVAHFTKKIQNKLGMKIKGFSTKSIKMLMSYDWPGNVRELENEVERAMTLAGDGSVIQPEYLSPKIGQTTPNIELPNALNAETLRDALDQVERKLIHAALEKYHWNKSEVSRQLGVSRLGLQKKLDRLDIKPET